MKDNHDPTRFWLVRGSGEGRMVAFAMLNPSTADDLVNDRTIDRCVSFAGIWGYKRLAVVNTNPMRSTDPKKTPTPTEEALRLNDQQLLAAGSKADMLVCAWGNNVNPGLELRALATLCRFPLYHLGLTKLGKPRHPLYLRSDTQLTKWEL